MNKYWKKKVFEIEIPTHSNKNLVNDDTMFISKQDITTPILNADSIKLVTKEDNIIKPHINLKKVSCITP